MHCAEVVGYALDGALYCVNHTPESKCKCEKDDNGLCSENCGGYGPNPVFAGEVEPGDACDVEGCGYLDGADPEDSEDEDEDDTSDWVDDYSEQRLGVPPKGERP